MLFQTCGRFEIFISNLPTCILHVSVMTSSGQGQKRQGRVDRFTNPDAQLSAAISRVQTPRTVVPVAHPISSGSGHQQQQGRNRFENPNPELHAAISQAVVQRALVGQASFPQAVLATTSGKAAAKPPYKRARTGEEAALPITNLY